MTTRYWEETPDPCGQDRMGEHWIDEMLGKDGLCPGGQRRELTDVEVRSSRNVYQRGEFYAQVIELGPGKPPGRYAIIPLEDR